MRELFRRVPSVLDALLIRFCGLPYALVTRDRMIHDRMRYLVGEIVKECRKVAVLDAGCGSGLALLYLDRYCRGLVTSYTGIDLATERIAQRYRFVSLPHAFLNIDLCSEWELKSYDIIFCSEVIEHIVEDGALLRRLGEHLSPKGILLLTTPNKEFVNHWARSFQGFDQVSQTQDGGHVRVGYNRRDLELVTETAGLAIIDLLFLSEIGYSELCYRERLRNHGQHVNTVRYNWRWLLGSSVTEHDRGHGSLSHWTIAVALTHLDSSEQSAKRGPSKQALVFDGRANE